MRFEMISKIALIIEDSKVHQQILARYLIQKGYDVFTAGDGEEGFTKFCTLAPNLVFIDIVLPKQSGFEVLNSIRLIDPAAIFVVMSASMTNKRLLRAREENVDWLLLKPFRKRDLYDILERHKDY